MKDWCFLTRRLVLAKFFFTKRDRIYIRCLQHFLLEWSHFDKGFSVSAKGLFRNYVTQLGERGGKHLHYNLFHIVSTIERKGEGD